jgi:hypothetical protein
MDRTFVQTGPIRSTGFALSALLASVCLSDVVVGLDESSPKNLARFSDKFSAVANL